MIFFFKDLSQVLCFFVDYLNSPLNKTCAAPHPRLLYIQNTYCTTMEKLANLHKISLIDNIYIYIYIYVYITHGSVHLFF